MKDAQDLYFKRYAWPKPLNPSFIPPHDLEMVVVIPSFKEPEVNQAVNSILSCQSNKRIIILVIINEPENASPEIIAANNKSEDSLEQSDHNSNIQLICNRIILPEKKAGVGLARKVGLDEAAMWFEKIKKDGILICFDADCVCESNYLDSI